MDLFEVIEKERHILKADTPEEYYRRLHKSELSHGRKASTTKKWITIHTTTKTELNQARLETDPKRDIKYKHHLKLQHTRYHTNNYRPDNIKYREWDINLINRFLPYTEKRNDRRYKYPDRVVAKEFKTTIGSVIYMRRKIRNSYELIRLLGNKPRTNKNIFGKRIISEKDKFERIVILGDGTIKHLLEKVQNRDLDFTIQETKQKRAE